MAMLVNGGPKLVLSLFSRSARSENGQKRENELLNSYVQYYASPGQKIPARPLPCS